VQQIENRRLSVSGVSIDEEMANMVKYQHAYNAAAKMISVIDQIYDVTINRMGA
jgi:flagellar hook-associated protein 1 FlgK